VRLVVRTFEIEMDLSIFLFSNFMLYNTTHQL